ncbi:Swi5-domain-containing protein [Delphinella strobiligena]|nr:Swi5-domain-containing protein [Delphinella strobiligena]
MALSSPTRPADPNPTTSRLKALRARELTLKSTLATLTAERDSLVDRTLSNTPQPHPRAGHDSQDTQIVRAERAIDFANAKTKAHINQLQQYNEVKDIGTQLMGMIAEKRGVRIVEVQKEFGVDEND